MNSLERVMLFRSMRALEKQREEAAGPRPPTRWQRWTAAVYRFADKMMGIR